MRDGFAGVDVHEGVDAQAEGVAPVQGLDADVPSLVRPDYLEMRYNQVLLRDRFDLAAKESDPNKARQLLLEGCEELWRKRHPQPLYKAVDPAGGISYGRTSHIRDGEADNLNWIEREQYPWYFNRRELRKKELLAHWEKVEGAWDQELAAIQRKPPPGDASVLWQATHRHL